MKTSATSFIKSILLIGYAQDYRVLLSKNFTTILPDATIDEYNIKDGCPGSAYNWKKHQLVIIDYDLGDGENGLEWIRACSASNDFPAVIMLTGKSNESVIVQAFRQGVQDFLRHDELSTVVLFESVQRTVNKYRQEQVMSDTITLSAHNL